MTPGHSIEPKVSKILRILRSKRKKNKAKRFLCFLGNGIFWVSLFNPSLISCDSSYNCTTKLRSAYGEIFRSDNLSSEFGISSKPCISLRVNATSSRFESVECETHLKVVCEAACSDEPQGTKMIPWTYFSCKITTGFTSIKSQTCWKLICIICIIIQLLALSYLNIQKLNALENHVDVFTMICLKNWTNRFLHLTLATSEDRCHIPPLLASSKMNEVDPKIFELGSPTPLK